MHRLTIVLILISAFSLSLSGQSTPVQLTYERSGVQWSQLASSAGMVLTVSGPEGFCFKQEYGANARPAFSVSDEQGLRRAEGTYLWELVVQLPTGEPQVLSGSFAIRAGRIIPFPENEYPVAVSEEAPANSLNIDREGRLGVGTTVPGAQLHVKGPEPGVTLEDTSLGGREYTLRSLERGDGSLGLFDEASGQARWLVDSEGRVGINTTQPTSTLTVDGYIESTKGFLVNGRPIRFGSLGGGAVPLSTEGDSNNFFGTAAGYSNTTGWSNAFFGSAAGYGNTTGYANSFFGHQAGRSNTTAGGNSFFGESSGYSNTTGNSNSFFGSGTGFSNSTGSSNSFFGNAAGRENTTGTANSFYGMAAGYYNTTGYDNSFFGGAAGNRNTTGISNSFFGRHAGYFQHDRVRQLLFRPPGGYL
jgi:hypothetical protein